MKNAILANLCILRFHYQKLIVLQTDFSSLGFRWVLCKLGNNKVTSKAVQDYRVGKGFLFMTKDLSAILQLVCFVGPKNHRNKIWLHSHLSKIFTGNYGMNKCRHMLFG
jgi:hypothetical protein